jgi:hypothetical protein
MVEGIMWRECGEEDGKVQKGCTFAKRAEAMSPMQGSNDGGETCRMVELGLRARAWTAAYA